MKTTLLTLTLVLIINSAFAQDTISQKISSPGVTSINVPDFADPEVKKLYTAYAIHLVKCVEAIRQKDEAKVTALFKNPGVQLVAREKVVSKEVVKSAVEKQKYMEFAAQAYPLIKEVQRSEYYQNLYEKK